MQKRGENMDLNNNYTVYAHKFPNDKYYVGITRQSPEQRWLNGKKK